MLTVHWLARRPACMGNIVFNFNCWSIPFGMYSRRKHVPFEMKRPCDAVAWRLRCTGGAGAVCKLRLPPGTETAPATSFPTPPSCPVASQRLVSRASTSLVPPSCSGKKPPLPSPSCTAKAATFWPAPICPSKTSLPVPSPSRSPRACWMPTMVSFT